jgi:hypothetical protein
VICRGRVRGSAGSQIKTFVCPSLTIFLLYHQQKEAEVMTLREWIKQFEGQFSERELEYQTVHKASIAVQLKDMETGNLHLHNLTYKAKDATDLVIKIL